MANITGVNGTVQVGSNTVAELKSFSIEQTGNTINNSNLNSTAESFVAGKTSWSASIEVQFDETDTTGQGAITVGSTITVNFGPEGSTVGDYQLSGSAVVTGDSMSVGEDAIVTKSFSLQGSGALTEGTF